MVDPTAVGPDGAQCVPEFVARVVPRRIQSTLRYVTPAGLSRLEEPLAPTRVVAVDPREHEVDRIGHELEAVLDRERRSAVERSPVDALDRLRRSRIESLLPTSSHPLDHPGGTGLPERDFDTCPRPDRVFAPLVGAKDIPLSCQCNPAATPTRKWLDTGSTPVCPFDEPCPVDECPVQGLERRRTVDVPDADTDPIALAPRDEGRHA